MQSNLLFAWIWVLGGIISGSCLGLFFYRQDWLGGYDAWERRMVRLGHISFLGTGLLNLGYGLSVIVLQLSPSPRFASTAFMVGAVTMPLVCFLSAWKRRGRYLFFIPVASLLMATGDMLWACLTR